MYVHTIEEAQKAMTRWTYLCLEEEEKSNLSPADKEEREILAALAVEQATKEEVMALDKWNEAKSDAESVSEFGKPWYFKNTHEQTSDTDLWDDEEGLNDLLNDYYDLMEMHLDGCQWEEEVEQSEMVRYLGYSTSHPVVCRLEKVGKNYWTAQMINGAGKIYIPQDLIQNNIAQYVSNRVSKNGVSVEDILMDVEVVFKGFKNCRGRYMPWRAIFIDLP